eukprot:5762847-Pleurochrysis_carterae.AAC.2
MAVGRVHSSEAVSREVARHDTEHMEIASKRFVETIRVESEARRGGQISCERLLAQDEKLAPRLGTALDA